MLAAFAAMLAAFALQAQSASAQYARDAVDDTSDSVKVTVLNDVEIYATRADKNTPITHTELSKEQLSKLNYGEDIPFMLTLTPSVVATSDAGAGIGYTSVRIRGVDASRINVTSNGVPMNDAESHSAFWVNVPDFASSIQDLQIQRGVGTSTNGSGAFGGSINIQTEGAGTQPFCEIGFSGGSYGTHRETVKFGTGLINGRWNFGARLSNIGTDGYIDRAKVRQKSFLAQGAYYGDKTVVKLIAFGGKEVTYHAWDGVTQEQIDLYGRRFNPCGAMERVVRNADGTPVRDSYGNVVTERTGFYSDQTDNYTQYNYQLVINRVLSDSWKLNATLHYTDGYGYYEEYKNAQRFVEYGLTPYAPANASKEAWLDSDGNVERSNLVRRKLMDNGFGGIVLSTNYTSERLTLTLGGAANNYDGRHFGNVIWIENYHGSLEPNHEYYSNESSKWDANVYAKLNYRIVNGLYLYADAQYRYIHHTISGTGDQWDSRSGQERMQLIDVDKEYSFFNPKAGLFWNIDNRNKLYGSFAVAHKEPTRNNHVEASAGREPRPERLFDYELGYAYSGDIFSAGVNLYYMDYKDQIVLTGRLNEIGEAVSDNVRSSYRAGIELQAGVRITDWLRWDVNATLSRNRIKNYTEYAELYDENYVLQSEQYQNYIGTTDIAFSPSVIAGSLITFNVGGFNAMLQTQYVGKQYVSNTSDSSLRLDDYCVTNLRMSYTFNTRKLKHLSVGIALNNLFGAKYSSNGWGATWYVKDSSTGELTKETLMGYYPQATANVLANVTIRF